MAVSSLHPETNLPGAHPTYGSAQHSVPCAPSTSAVSWAPSVGFLIMHVKQDTWQFGELLLGSEHGWPKFILFCFKLSNESVMSAAETM